MNSEAKTRLELTQEALTRCDEACSAARREYQGFEALYNGFEYDTETQAEKLGQLMRKTEYAIAACKKEIAEIEQAALQKQLR